MRRLAVRWFGPHSAISALLRPSHRLDVASGFLFMLSLVAGTMFWDEMMYGLDTANRGYWAGMALCASLAVLFLSSCRRKWPLIACVIFVVLIRIAFAFAGFAPGNGMSLNADCVAVCFSLYVLVFRGEIFGSKVPTETEHVNTRVGAKTWKSPVATLEPCARRSRLF